MTEAQGHKPKADAPNATPAPLDELGQGRTAEAGGSLDRLKDVSLNVRIELGRARMTVDEIAGLQGGSVVTLDKLAGDMVDVVVNGKLVARGEVLVLGDQFCIRIAEIVSPEERESATKG